MNPIELRGMTKTYPFGSGGAAFTLGPLDLVVPRGYVMGLVGANGAGKTTAIKIALGMVHPTSGSAAVVPHERIGVVFDQPSYVGEWTAAQVPGALAPFYPHWDHATFARLLAWGDIEPSKKIKELSRGMGMRLQLVVALSHGAELLILDEPTAGLDPLARSQLLEMIAEFMVDESHSVLFSSHITTDLEKVADYVTVLHEGRVLASTTRDDLTDAYRIVRGSSSGLDAVRPLVRGLREHGQGWEGLMATEDTVNLGHGSVVEAPTLEEIVIHLAKEPHHV